MKLIPSTIKAKILKSFRNYERGRRLQAADGMPIVELQDKHIANTKLLPNRERLLAELPRGGTVAEIGVNQGDFSRKILEVTKPIKLHLIDVWGSERYHDGLAEGVKKKFADEIASDQVEINRGFSTEVLPGFRDGTFDWVYIDSAHTYEVTRDELAVLNSKVKEGGFICGHDYINSCWRNAVKYGVVEAVHEFCVKEGWELVYLTNETHQHLSFCIKRL